MTAPRILVADDEPLLRAELVEALERLWPEAQIAAAQDGIEALRQGREWMPDVAFLDIRMPGLDGLEVARVFGARTHVVFVTAYGEHALAAFDEGAVDYVVKPIALERVARAVERVRARLASPPPDLTHLVSRLQPTPKAPAWLQATVGNTIHFIDLADVVYFCADAKYTRVVTDGLEAHIRLSLKELTDSLDPDAFWQIHRGYMVAVRRIASAARAEDGALWVHLRGHPARLPVSQRFQYLFRGM
ncbi:LytTR family DNA-binding domain-containing protein [Telluria mixta]|uniref:LytTR family DNA-binding domain-containing protein n=1 Tax=Telluria mixta TaxID=34071 RepID=A0ABT2C2V5_9BURK|nr:LytTR family DNA-binding domain-containing protein [Telluria mixta]MCS0631717.1 LytTR family DNA-binding domain-containing protein [Telluria mixta]WEM98464.1 LytTR family DNA-binding domain-containing protein [Telluria mixta]